MLLPVRTAAPVEPPVSLAEVKAHLRIDHTDEDPTLDIYLSAATDYLDGPGGILGKALVTQTWLVPAAKFTSPIWLPAGLTPVQSVTEINYFDGDNVTQILDEDVYSLVINDEDGSKVVLQADQTWPTTYTRDDAVSVSVVAGYGAPNAVPGKIRQAMLLLVGDWYTNREASSPDAIKELPFAVRSLLANSRSPVI